MSEKKENFFKRELAYNTHIKNNLLDIRNDIENCNSSEDIINTFESYKDEKNLVYKNKIFYISLLIALVIGSIGLYIAFLSKDFGLPFIILSVIAFIFLIIGTIYKKTDDERQSLISFIEDKYLEGKYKFQIMAQQEDLSHEKITNAYQHLFKKGNYSNDIPYFVSGSLTHNQKPLPYTVFKYHFVDKRTETYRENGKNKKRVVYDHFDNWGIFISNIECASFSITNYRNKHFSNTWTTSSIDFDRRHSISGSNEMELAKLFQPANVLMFEKLLSKHPTFELTCNSAIPTVCWNFNWDVLKRVNSNANNCISSKQFSGHLANLHMPAYEQLLKNLNPLLDKMVH